MTIHFHYPSKAVENELRQVARALVAPGKGILAQDTEVDNIGGKFKEIGLENSEENRRAYRQLLFSTEGLNEHIAGVILFHESVYHTTDDGTPFPQYLHSEGILPGVKADTGLTDLPAAIEQEWVTQGLDNLGQRLAQYKEVGIRFAKWRAAFRISEHTPSALTISDNVNALARYAAICQSQGIVPIVEPDVSMDGSHDLERNQKVTETVLAALYKALNDHHVFLEGTILKTNMVTPGFEGPEASDDDIARATVEAFSRTVPAAVAGVGFLSGGMGENEATDRLNAINLVQDIPRPWPLTFCYGRAIENSVLRAWGGKNENVAVAQEQLWTRCNAVGLASLGKYKGVDNVQANCAQRHRL